MKPTFIGIGAQKCASSWLYDILSDHPEVVVSEKKELDFFSYQYERGYEWYEAQFQEKLGARAVGEISPSYFNEASVPERIKLYAPEAKILLSLRSPVERALSQHRHLVRIGYVTGPDFSFEHALNYNPSYLEQGQYARHLSRWLEHFPSEQVKIVLMEDILQSPQHVARSVYQFLNIDPEHLSGALNEKSNPSYAIRSRSLDQMICTLRGAADRTGLGPVWRGVGQLGLQRFYRGINRRPSQQIIPKARPETLENLKEAFREDTIKLQTMLGTDLSAWL